MTKMFVLGALGVGAVSAGVAALRARQRRAATRSAMSPFDYADLDEPVVVTEEVLVITEMPGVDVEMDAMGSDAFDGSGQTQPMQQQPQSEQGQSPLSQQTQPEQAQTQGQTFEMPGRGGGPR